VEEDDLQTRHTREAKINIKFRLRKLMQIMNLFLVYAYYAISVPCMRTNTFQWRSSPWAGHWNMSNNATEWSD